MNKQELISYLENQILQLGMQRVRDGQSNNQQISESKFMYVEGMIDGFQGLIFTLKEQDND